MDEHERTRLLRIKAINLELLSPYNNPAMFPAALKDPVFRILSEQTCLIDSLLLRDAEMRMENGILIVIDS